MGQLLYDVAEGKNLGDTTTLAEESVMSELRKRASEALGEAQRALTNGVWLLHQS